MGGFMVMFMILFSEQDVFNSNFFGVFGKVLVMMTGEFEYEELMYPQTEKVSNSSKIEDEIDFNHFPGLAHISVLAFIIFVGVVMMNLLVAIAVNDIKELAKTAKRDQLLSQAELINYMERIHGFWVFQKLLPSKIQDWFKATVLNRGRSVTMTKEVLAGSTKLFPTAHLILPCKSYQVIQLLRNVLITLLQNVHKLLGRVGIVLAEECD